MGVTVTQAAHGFTLPTAGVTALRYNSGTSTYVAALADDPLNAADVLLVAAPSINTLTFQNHGPRLPEAAHGLQVGKHYVLSPTTPGLAVPKDTLVSGDNLQYLFFVASPTQLLLNLQPMDGVIP